ncbi:MAG: hypothetical protein WAM61_20555 [Desulfobacterales bacterium]
MATAAPISFLTKRRGIGYNTNDIQRISKEFFVKIAYKFKGYRVLLVHNDEPFWDDIHSRIMKTDCDLFAVNSTKDASRLMQLMAFDIIISAYDRHEVDGWDLFRHVTGSNRNAIKILQKKRSDCGMKWRLQLSSGDGQIRNSLELESMLAVISGEMEGNGDTGQVPFYSLKPHPAGIHRPAPSRTVPQPQPV